MRPNILDVPVDAQTQDMTLAQLQAWLRGGARVSVSTCTVYTIMTAQDDPLIMKALQAADMVTADGMPLVWLQRAFGFYPVERVYGPDLLVALCERTPGARHYFVGGLPGVTERLMEALQLRFPDIVIAGYSMPTVSSTNIEVDAQVAAEINAAAADIVWVGLGSPKQDVWMWRYRPYLNASLLIGVGAAFDFVSGVKRQAPLWMQRSGLEWLFRLLQEPRRLWKRYLVYNPRFVWAVFRAYVLARATARRRIDG